MKPKWWNKSRSYLIKKDKVISKLIKSYKGHLTTRNNFFYSLTRSIISQQISVAAADSVFSKFEKKCKNKIIPIKIINLSTRSLRNAGLSRQKVSYLKNIAKSFKNKSFNVSDLKKMSDDQAINYIIKLKGLGVWSAQMFLMFNLNRPDIFPTKDIGLIRAISKNYKTSYPPSDRFLNKLSRLHAGYRSVFTWYMWKSIDPVDVEY